MSNANFYAEVYYHLSYVMKKYLKEDKELTRNLKNRIEREAMNKFYPYTSTNEERRKAHRFIVKELTQIQNRQMEEKSEKKNEN
jgi:hypothetical protein